MTEVTHCPECGAKLGAGTPKGLCSRCALKGALELSAESQADLELPRRFGDYVLLEEIARGGLLAVDANDDLTDTLSRLEITGTGLGALTILNEASLDVPLRVERVGSSVRAFWPKPATGFLLEETHTLAGSPIPWTQVPVSTYQTNQTDISITVPAPSASKFYRLRRP